MKRDPNSDLAATGGPGTSVTTADFPDDLRASMERLRGAFIELLQAMDDDTSLPQEMSRRYGINKNLSWKVCKIINAEDVSASVQHVPGAAGIRILLDAYTRSGAPQAVVEGVSRAVDGFEQMIRTHVGDRANLQLYVGSTQPEGVHSEMLEDKRRLAYQGNSAIWGVQARLGFALRLIAPNAEQPERLDMVSCGGLMDFRRLRPNACWPVLQRRALGEGIDPTQSQRLPVDPTCGPDDAPLLKPFCSTPLPELRTVHEEARVTYELREGPVGNTAALDIVFATIERAAVPIWGDDDDSVGEHYCQVDTPLEHAQFDLLVHRDLPFEAPGLVTYSRLHDELKFPLSRQERYHLPGISEVEDLGMSHHGLATPHVREYARIVDLAAEAIGQPVEAFHKYRVSFAYPPMPTVLCMSHRLPQQPG